MPRLGTILGRERPPVDGEHRLFKPRPTPLDPLMRTPVITAGAKRRTTMRGQLRQAQKCRTRLVDGLVDALVTQPHRRVVREPPAQLTGNLLRAPPLEQQLTDQLAELEVGLNAPPMITDAPRRRMPMSLKRAVTPAPGRVAAQLARDRRGRPSRSAIRRILHPAWRRSAISIRSSCDRNLGLT